MFNHPDNRFSQHLGSVYGGNGQVPAQHTQFGARHNGHPDPLFFEIVTDPGVQWMKVRGNAAAGLYHFLKESM
jgi:hypothetical protein